jgi:hypothetical protein
LGVGTRLAKKRAVNRTVASCGALVAGLLVITGCEGEIRPGDVTSPFAPGGGSGPTLPQPAPPCTRAVALPAHVGMISAAYYQHALESLFPAHVVAAAQPLLAALDNSDPKAPFRTMTRGGGLTTVTAVFELAWSTAFVGLTDADLDALDPCLASWGAATSAAQAACIDTVLAATTARILRHAPSAEELTRARTEFDTGATDADQREGLRFVIAWLLQHPAFVYHLETGLEAPGPLSHDEVLARMSRTLWDAPPDAALVAQAAGLDLLQPDAREQLARQMLADPRAGEQLTTFYTQLLRLDDPVSVTTNPLVLEGVDPATLHGDALTEAQSFVKRVAFDRPGTLADVFTSSDAVVPSANLARVYGIDAAQVGQATSLPGRGGLLERAAMLINAGDKPNVFHFGALVARNVLCMSIPPPDPAFLLEADKIVIPPDASARERAELLTGSGTCVACHGRFNGFGYARTGFSTVGRKVQLEKIFDAQGNVVREAPVDTTAALTLDGQRSTVADLAGASVAIAGSDDAARCFVTRFLSYADGRATGAADECLAEHVARDQRAAQGTLQDALVRVVRAGEFVTRGAP